MRSAAYKRRECHASYVHTHLLHLFLIFLHFFQHVFHMVSCICRNLIKPSFKQDVVIRNGYFSPIGVCFDVISFFYFNLISQNALIFSQIESDNDSLLWKNHVQRSTGNKVYRACLILLLLLRLYAIPLAIS